MSNTIVTDIAEVAAEVEKADSEAIAALSRHSGPTIAIWNQSTVLTDEQIIPVVAALQIQVSRDFAKAWGLNANLVFVPKANTPTPGQWRLVVLDDSTQAGALGFHDVGPDNQPQGSVFAKTDLATGSSWEITISHELLEMLADPGIQLTAFVESGNGGTLYSLEVADSPEGDQYGYLINGILVSNFVFPSWFQSFWAPNSTQFDQQKLITQPFQLLPGGYISVYQISGGNGWSQLTADRNPKTLRQSRGSVGSRRERRRTPRDQWQKSTQ